MGNAFTLALTKHDTVTWNQAISNSSSGNFLLDYFGKCGSYRGRQQQEVDISMSSIFAEDTKLALQLMFYNRMITRKINGVVETDTVQRGQGQKDEFIKSLAWLEQNSPDLLYKNLWMIPSIGCWKDLWYDSTSGFHYYVEPVRVYELIKYALQNQDQRALLAKYLPKIRSKSNIKNKRQARLNSWAKELAKYLGWSHVDYRKFKSNPEYTAHLWQRQACSGQWKNIDFNTIPGKALFNLVSHKGKDGKTAIERNNLTQKYLEWIKSKPIAKFTGYPYELYKAAKTNKRNLIQTYTYNSQFEGLLDLARKDMATDILQKGVLCALDTSGSMTWETIDQQDTQPLDVCLGLGIYFSSLMTGYFADTVISFSSISQVKRLKGNFCQKVDQAQQIYSGGSTNFQSVIDEIVRIRNTHPEVPIEDYPQVLLVISDMQFNPTNPTGYITCPYTTKQTQTNYEQAMQKLRQVGLPDMTIIWWQVNGKNTSDFPSTIDDPGTVLISGFDGSIVTSILGGQEKIVDKHTGEERFLNPYEQMIKALDQEILNMVQI